MTPDPLPVYSYWDKVPDGLMTKTQLAKEHMKPGGPVRARVEYTAYKRLRSYDLYNVDEAIKTNPTPAQLAALEKARIKTRTCTRCGKVVDKPSDLRPRGRCDECQVALAQLKRAREVDETILWARRMLATPDALILDTETIDLHDYICEIGIIRMDGTVVFDGLIDPQVREIRATHIHGITRDMVWSAPTFADVEPELRRILHGKTVVVYNAEYDSYVLRDEIKRMCTPSAEQLAWLVETDWGEWGTLGYGHYWREWQGQGRVLVHLRDDERKYRWLIDEHASWWRDRVDWQCAMLEYSTFVGDWSDYYRNYRYQPLGGGHRAIGDCRACLEVLHLMAGTRLSTEMLSGQALDDKLDEEAYAMQLERDGRHPDNDPAQWQKVT